MDGATKAGSILRSRLLPGTLCAALLFGVSLPVVAAEFEVTTTVDSIGATCSKASCSLREAILAANAIGAPSTIHLPAGIYSLSIAGADEDDGLTGDFDIHGDITFSGVGTDLTGISIAGNFDHMFQIHQGARARFQNLWIYRPPTSTETGALAESVTPSASYVTSIVSSGTLELDNVTLGAQGLIWGDTIHASGVLRMRNSRVHSGSLSEHLNAIFFTGEHLEIIDSVIRHGRNGVQVRSTSTSASVSIVGSTFIADGNPNNDCQSLRIQGQWPATSIGDIRIERSEVRAGLAPASIAPTCLEAAKISISDSAFLAGSMTGSAITGQAGLRLTGPSSVVRNSTIVGSIRTSGDLWLDHVTSGNLRVLYHTLVPVAIDNAGASEVVVSNSALLGSCLGGNPVAHGNNVEALGDTCGLPPASSWVNVTEAQLALQPLGYNNGSTLNYLPTTGSPLIGVFTPDGVARCAPTDQRGFVRATTCTIGATEANATEQVLFRNGFDR